MSLTREETLVFRALKRTAVVLMVVRYLDKPVGEGDIAAILDIDHKTARAHLRSLAALGLLTRLNFHRGYQLTHAGRQMALPLEPFENQPDPARLEAGNPGDFPDFVGDEPRQQPLSGDLPRGQAETPDPARAAQDTPPGDCHPALGEPSEPGPTSPHDPGKFPGCLTINHNNKDISLQESIISINPHPGKDPVSAGPGQELSVQPSEDGVADRAGALPAENLDSPGPDGYPSDPLQVAELPANDPRLVAGTLAAVGIALNARTRRLLGRISTDDVEAVYRDLVAKRKGSETGLLIYMLEKIADPEQPHLEFPENPWGYRRLIQTEPEQEGLEEGEICEAEAVEITFDGPPEIERAWGTVLGLVKAELPKAAFDTWLAHAMPLAWDAETAVLRVGVANSYARDWLELRVKYLILPYLAGVLNTRVVSVKFVVG